MASLVTYGVAAVMVSRIEVGNFNPIPFRKESKYETPIPVQ